MTEGENKEAGGTGEMPPGEMPLELPVEERRENGEWKADLTEKPAPPAAEEPEFVHPEGGWGWVVMLSSMWCNGSVFGIQNSFGLMFLYLLQAFGPKNDPEHGSELSSELGFEYDQDLRFRTCEYNRVEGIEPAAPSSPILLHFSLRLFSVQLSCISGSGVT